MRVVVTGGTGFIGGRVVALLRERGDEVVALVRDAGSEEAAGLAAGGSRVVEADLTHGPSLRAAMAGADAVVHAAGSYRVGIAASERPAMYAANVTATREVIDSAWETGVSRIVHLSTVNAFGDTHGQVVDEGYRRDPAEGYLSYYDETKHAAHELAADRAARGAPVVIVQPGAVYGPGDHSPVDTQVRRMLAGTLPAVAFGDVGLAMVHVDDVARGVLLALDRGVPGQGYVLAGETLRLRDLLRRVAAVTGATVPGREVPSAVLRGIGRLGGGVRRRAGLPPDVGEVARASDGVTYWATADRARHELGWTSRPLDEGLRETYAAGAS